MLQLKLFPNADKVSFSIIAKSKFMRKRFEHKRKKKKEGMHDICILNPFKIFI